MKDYGALMSNNVIKALAVGLMVGVFTVVQARESSEIPYTGLHTYGTPTGCVVRLAHLLKPSEHLRWDGRCSGEYATGEGVLSIVDQGGRVLFATHGLMKDGIQVGVWTDRPPKAVAQLPATAKESPKAEAAANIPGRAKPGQTFRDCADCPEMIVIPAGSFDMGSPSGEPGRQDNEGPRHKVSIRSFAAGKYEITRGQFAAFVAASGYNAGNECDTSDFVGGEWKKHSGRNWQNPGYPQDDSHPVVCVNWNDAKAYVAWLSRKTGKNYRLLSEAEWEYAARAGTTTAWHWGESPDQACSYANVVDATGKSPLSGIEGRKCTDDLTFTVPVGSFRPNAFGLYDMIGNVAEFTEDCWNGNYDGAPTDGSAWTSGKCQRRILRGGLWESVQQDVRSARRELWAGTAYRSGMFGFRVARMLP